MKQRYAQYIVSLLRKISQITQLSAQHIVSLVLLLASGIMLGVVIAMPAKNTEFPPVSATSISQEMRQQICLHSKSFISLSDAENRLPAQPYTTARAMNVKAIPLSDRGLICDVSGTINTVSPDGKLHSTGFEKHILVTVDGSESEFVSKAFAQKLLASAAITQIASNDGRRSTMVDAPGVPTIE